ncbi:MULTISPECIES: hypothetical protein [unclassified Mesorhizobium]|uniref:hypothetical protein n=1 Tax=unclassified Mesorhizobium TaxID=325217 RepID=UPI000FD7E8F7|nr:MULTISPECIES: hypothetical protein [unclassified Mesorhizobium]TGR58263.1 hypothetical protein EN842_01335 [bacterium M00.F.Ca.ET.199.01.1.1]TGU41629.1 hypothetical protein EN799_03480 [bacterium M00.F.Ca.ET.156.01.1.1]TGV89747.1 hypothetical protein EN792_006205 [Mesorhizobium sp. M00.F.Ca.ET.149.01.1.1]TGR33005.1 hypothetical protein EN840_01335 [Mesorhizobium sp. M8A.F.Ca.ET.197.01.1.1]TGR34651.1 hypothetical protein EN845_01335 [Mesorhizobium sp. M8A.F.Ca.ET.202.01.1.1]
MTALVITAANVAAGANSTRENGTAGASITAGQVVYKAADGTYKLADTNDASAVVRKPRGIALHAASAGQPLAVHLSGPITIGATVTPGVAYYLGGTPGAIVPVADLTTGDHPALLGLAASTTVINIDIQAPDAAL